MFFEGYYHKWHYHIHVYLVKFFLFLLCCLCYRLVKKNEYNTSSSTLNMTIWIQCNKTINFWVSLFVFVYVDILIITPPRYGSGVLYIYSSLFTKKLVAVLRPVCLSVYLCVCLSVREHISGTAEPIFTNILCRSPVAVARSSWRRCDIRYALPHACIALYMAYFLRCWPWPCFWY